jgi:hypothetical protein
MTTVNKLPIYDELVVRINDTEGKSFDWDRIRSAINQLTDETQLEILYALILHHYFLEQSTKGGNMRMIPYLGKTPDPTGRGVLYNVSNLPLNLQKIIALYVTSLVTL